MTPQTQAYLHDPANGQRGDCWRTAVACLLDVDRDEVPHVVERDLPLIQKAMNGYLAKHHLAMMEMPLSLPTVDDVRAWMAKVNPGVPYLLSGTTPRGFDHVVVCADDEEPWDPHPSRQGLIGPCEDGFWWIAALVRRDVI